MKRTSILLLAAVIGAASALPAGATAAEKAQTYKNCTALNKDYPGGVAISSSTKNKGGKTKHKPHASKALYEANKKSDRDKDGIACEK
ncbi:excalibur calcium-binding domain-containing protein [Paenibacillus albicereus]|uniref:Excalibur calcium-binding domain-containing protein n=1 Tax=Paenibacillus albicereus TaxID=2726185 RepID=A0A6H2H0R8_9BACL|nr:excalibur calcium-binding domain-containing protein [Paenibacillus albicereus]QJC53284.1 excalibur calcium-binding domain-containing protein [Paenibacillus albicereus]